MKSYIKYKDEAIALRRTGKTYTEIRAIIEPKIPKSTLSDWFKNTTFSPEEKERIANNAKQRTRDGHIKALAMKRVERDIYFREIQTRLMPLARLLNDKNIAKVALLMLYWCEGGKHRRGSVQFGNSDPNMIRLFVSLLRQCHDIDEGKFRCTVQCRADQNPKELEIFWSQITNIPLAQFYLAQIDPRTLGKPSQQLDYKGVCRIDYFSAKVYHELVVAREIF